MVSVDSNASVDVLLIQPPVQDFYFTAKRSVPYGLSVLASSLKNAGVTVDILDGLATLKSKALDFPLEMAYLSPYFGVPDHTPFALFHSYRHFGYNLDHLAQESKRRQPTLIGLSSLFTAYAGTVHGLARRLKRILPDVPIVVGGHHATAFPETLLADFNIDYVIRGEGILALPALYKALHCQTPVSEIPGIAFRYPDGQIHMAEPADAGNPEEWPSPDLSCINHKFYGRKQGGTAVIVASKGCPMGCAYCCVSRHTIPWQQKSVSRVLDEMADAIEGYGARFIDFEDENLTFDASWFHRLLDGIINRWGHLGLTLRAMNGLFPPTLTPEIIDKMHSAGFDALNLSVGSFSRNTLSHFKRPDVFSSVSSAASHARRLNMGSVCYLIAGAPYQDPADSLRDLLVVATLPSLVGVSIYYPAPGSLDFQMFESKGILPGHHIQMRSSAFFFDHATPRTSSVTLLRLGRILNYLKRLISEGKGVPKPGPLPESVWPEDKDRDEVAATLVSALFHDRIIYGGSPGKPYYAHKSDNKLINQFIDSLDLSEIQSSVSK